MKLYTVKVDFDFVVVANDETEAQVMARSYAGDAFGDISKYDLDFDVYEGVPADGWDDECIPYGGDGNTRTGEYKNGDDNAP